MSGVLDPRGGTEAAKVLRDHSQQAWKDAVSQDKGSASFGMASNAGRQAASSNTTQKDAEGSAGRKGSQGASSRVQVQQPHLLHDGSSNYAGTDIDETGPGLEKALAQGGATQ